ncbi:MAG: DNA-directed RNA polymerase subunit beta', partial [Saccharofermentans sp.]|nr:DNA-directed RNA polymerase subunit beta' [Saccharofermentans sp.]
MYDSNHLTSIGIKLASPEVIKGWSHGEVKKPETINYRTQKPETDGLFCEKIFGPTKSWECHCGKYKKIRYKGMICDRCGVEVTKNTVRRERMGHIELAAPVSHIWYFRGIPSRMSLLLDIPPKTLERVLYFASYIVIDPGQTDLTKCETIDEARYREYVARYGKSGFDARMGAEAVKKLLQDVDIDALAEELNVARAEASGQKKARIIKRLEVVEAFKNSGNKPEWMILDVLPVLPPELRPMVPLDGGRYATSDLNDLYRRVINRNNRLKKLLDLGAPDIIVRNEKRMLQEAVDSLIDNGRRGRAVTGSTSATNNRQLKSLTDMLKGKQGRFRQNLLGKRVDYSGRSVIVVGPELKMHQCGLPKEMALELFKPFVIKRLVEDGLTANIKTGRRMVDRMAPEVWGILEDIIKDHPVMLNRAPTLHRLGIQAFEPILVEGRAIKLHPLVCTAFNADFDGDQMAVHVPLGNAAVLEAQILMLASHNILNPSNGAPITLPSQDMVLGLYYITKPRKSTPDHPVKGEGMSFYSPEEVIIAHNEGRADMHAVINVRVKVRENDQIVTKKIETTVGRVVFNQVVPEGFGYINQLLTKKSLRTIVGEMVRLQGTAITTKFLDDIKNMGYYMAYKGGLSFNLGNVLVPAVKGQLIEEANGKAAEIREYEKMGFMGPNERYNQIVDLWTDVNAKLTREVMDVLSSDDQGFNPVYMMLHSGARGSEAQVSQLCGMRGLMAKPMKAGSGGSEIIENPILSNFQEGLSVLEYFISTHGARKGLSD